MVLRALVGSGVVWVTLGSSFWSLGCLRAKIEKVCRGSLHAVRGLQQGHEHPAEQTEGQPVDPRVDAARREPEEDAGEKEQEQVDHGHLGLQGLWGMKTFWKNAPRGNLE